MKRSKKILTFYRDEMVPNQRLGFSNSPNKPKLLMNWLRDHGLMDYFQIVGDWKPLDRDDFYIAHTEAYVDNFFQGIEPYCSSNGLKWSRELADSIRYTCGSLYHAISYACMNPESICFSPTSGFHHATPYRGNGFCSMSGQVIASVKVYKNLGLSGAYIDLDGHYGNSIDDSMDFVSELQTIIPMNINPSGYHNSYIQSLKESLKKLKEKILTGKVHYVVACSGADSLVDDDLGGQVTLSEWVHCKTLVYQFIQEVSDELQTPIPLIITLFGGYRQDDYNSVLDAHTLDLLECLKILTNQSIPYQSKYKYRK